MSKPVPVKRKRVKIWQIVFAVVLLAVVAVASADLIQAHNSNRLYLVDPDEHDLANYPDNVPATPAKLTTSTGCDASLWEHVHQPSRLKIYDNCKQITGTILEIYSIDDGDSHILIRPDLKYISLLNINNYWSTRGALVVEAVCVQAPTNPGAEAACKDYHSGVNVPRVGSHVTVTGPFVRDMPHNWNEIHPVASIVKY
jgi:hypothetical protein